MLDMHNLRRLLHVRRPYDSKRLVACRLADSARVGLNLNLLCDFGEWPAPSRVDLTLNLNVAKCDGREKIFLHDLVFQGVISASFRSLEDVSNDLALTVSILVDPRVLQNHCVTRSDLIGVV